MDETLWVKGRAAFITTLVAIALNPISITLGYYLGESLQAPKLGIEYVTVEVETEGLKISQEVHVPIRSNLLIRQQLDRSISYKCDGWLKSAEISRECLEPSILAVRDLLSVFGFEQKIVGENLAALGSWDGESELLLTPMVLPGIGGNFVQSARENPKSVIDSLKGYQQSANRRREEANELLAALVALDDSEESEKRTGKVNFRVGILNSGDSDGVLFPAASFEIGGTSIALDRGSSREYQVVKAHSFAELTYYVNDKDSSSAALKRWDGYISARQQESLRVSIEGSNGSLTASTQLPP